MNNAPTNRVFFPFSRANGTRDPDLKLSTSAIVVPPVPASAAKIRSRASSAKPKTLPLIPRRRDRVPVGPYSAMVPPFDEEGDPIKA